MTGNSVHQCPKCGEHFKPALNLRDACPRCGLYFFKWNQPTRTSTQESDENPGTDGPLMPRLLAFLLTPPERTDSLSFYGRALVLLPLAVWGVFLFGADYRTGEIGQSFMHNILLPIHEAGHVLFIPFGEFMTILGGSLFQLALPFGIGLAFMLKQHDNVGAAFCLWWTGASLVDLAPYIYDALMPQLILLGGGTGEDGPHDWIYLLGEFGLIGRSHGLGAAAHSLGGLVMLLAVIWAAALLWKQRSQHSA